jgi:hypothetical protein
MSTSSGSPPSATSGRLYCRLRYWQMFCVTTLLTSCLAYRKARHPLVKACSKKSQGPRKNSAQACVHVMTSIQKR